jgi:ribosomal protein L12E/L44/L45/RPP1/RPP2
MKLLQNVINHKINKITTDELLNYADQYGVQISEENAKKIAAHLRGKNINVFDDRERSQLVKEIAKIAGTKTAKEVNIFIQFTK